MDAEIAVLRSGRVVKRILRPIRSLGRFQSTVTYRGQVWQVVGGRIDLDAGPVGLPSELDRSVPKSQVSRLAATEQKYDVPRSLGPTDHASLLALPVSARTLIDAGPGTGKTFAACTRVARLIRDGVTPSRIWIVSFTRTAIVELRNRIAAALENSEDAHAIRIATLDSHAWSLQSGFSEDATLTRSTYEGNIDATLIRIKGDADVREYLGRLEHLVIDEAQDIVGSRSDLLLSLIDCLSDECGVTAFCDRAQAIYGFTEDDAAARPARTFIEQLESKQFSVGSLAKIYRTNDPKLIELYSKVRETVILPGAALAKYGEVRQRVEELAHAVAGSSAEFRLQEVAPGSLILFRRRSDVLSASSWNAHFQHRIRMSGLPTCVHPYFAELFWDYTEPFLTKTSFVSLWSARMKGDAPESEWANMVEVAGRSSAVVNMAKLRSVLSRPAPPMVFCSPEFGEGGPVLGTIHASKGREASEVLLFLPPAEDPTDEETRVLFVGASRAREKLVVGSTSKGAPVHSAHGRAWRRLNGGKVQVEVGRAGDIDANGLVGRAAFPDPKTALDAQDCLRRETTRAELVAKSSKDTGWRHSLEADGMRLALLSAQFRNDMSLVGRWCKCLPPRFMPHLRTLGNRSLVLPVDSPALEELHEPWRSSGFILAPLLFGYSTTLLKANRKWQ